MRHHRLLELFLHEKLGFSWDEVHEEASRLDHVLSQALADRITAVLDDPRHDPHGQPIPIRQNLIEELKMTNHPATSRPPQTAASRSMAETLAHFRATHPRKQLVVSGVTWEYTIGGQGTETIVLLPGAHGNGEQAFPLILKFEETYRVIAVSLPLLGTANEIVEGVAAIITAKNAAPVHLIGGSYGGALAQYFVRRHPGKVASLVLSHTVAPDPERARRNQKWIKLLKWIPARLILFLLNKEVDKVLPPQTPDRQFWQDYLKESMTRLGKEGFFKRLQAGMEFDAKSAFTAADLRDWHGRVLILEGENDPMVKTAGQERLKALYPQAQVRTFADGGHASSLLQPGAFVVAIETFLQENGRFHE